MSKHFWKFSIIGKTPENDCLPIELYSVFWPLIVRILVERFNEAYERKELSNSQRKVIVALVQKT